MDALHELDIYQRVRRNRVRLAVAFIAAGVLIMGLSGACLYLLHRTARTNVNFWILLLLFWLCFLIYAILRYAIGGNWIFKRLVTLPPWETDHELRDALDSTKLASGMVERVRLMVIPDPDINTLSLSLPDGSFALFATEGIANKLPQREREAIMAHEIAHMQMGDTLIYTILVRLAGRRALKKMVTGKDLSDFPFRLFTILAIAALGAWVVLVLVMQAINSHILNSSSGFWLAMAFIVIGFATFLPLLMHKLLQWTLDREREYYADVQSVYLTRDPEAVYLALKDTAEDVRDVLLLPACFDTLLFNPVVDFTNYRPFRSQPTMAARMQRLKEAFPQIDI